MFWRCVRLILHCEQELKKTLRRWAEKPASGVMKRTKLCADQKANPWKTKRLGFLAQEDYSRLQD